MKHAVVAILFAACRHVSGFASGFASSPPPPPPLQVLIISDFHTEPEYDNNLGSACRCILRDADSEEACRLAVPASPYGQYGCNAPETLVDAALAAAAEVLPAPDLILVLGDYVGHDSPSKDWTLDVFESTAAKIASTFANRPRACRAPLGNNDAFPNYGVNVSDPHFYAQQAEVARHYCGLDEENVALFARTGYYMVTIPGPTGTGVIGRFVILNTNVYAVHNEGMINEDDPLDQFAWLEAHLQDADREGYLLHITSHIPPTIDSYGLSPQWQPKYAAIYWALLSRYASVVGLQLYGHLHSHEVRVAPAGPLDKAPVLQVVSAVSPIYSSRPVFYTLEMPWEAQSQRNWDLTNVTSMVTYTADLGSAGSATKAPKFTVMDPPWPRPLYNNDEVRSLLASFYADDADDDETYQTWFRFLKVGFQPVPDRACEQADDTFQKCTTCTAGCRIAFVCNQERGITEEDYRSCLLEHGQK